MAGPIPVAVSAPIRGAGDDTVNLEYPSGIQAGDILIALVFVDAGVAMTITSYDDGEFVRIDSTATGVRRGVAVYKKLANGTEVGGGTTLVTILTSLNLATLSGVIAVFREGQYDGIHASGTAGITSSTTPAPASITTTEANELAVAAIAYSSTTTITNLTGDWTEGIVGVLAQNDGTWSFDFQTQAVPSATTISGNTATLGASANWGVITFAIKSKILIFLPTAVIIT